MADGFSGRKLVLKLGDGADPEVFTTIAGLRDTTVTRTDSEVNTTTKDDNGYRTLLSDRTMQALSISGTGVFVDSATFADTVTAFNAGTLNNFEIDVVSTDATTAGEVLEGAFKITQLEQAGAHDGEVNYSITLESSGQVTSS